MKKIKESIGRIKLNREKKKLKRVIKSFGLDNASSIGIIYDATNRNTSDTVKKFIHFLIEERKEVESLGFINSKDESNLVSSTKHYTYFSVKDLSKTGLVPSVKSAVDFINQPFSILIDLNTAICFPIEYITSLSKAKFKVGASGNYRDDACDLVIDVSSNNNLSYLIIQIKHYLKMIQPTKV